VVDLGRQDSKVIILDDCGAEADVASNDKCAAGTGRFLEVMAGVLGVTLEEMDELSLGAVDAVTINATCTVFAESEVVSLIAQRRAPADIIAGVHQAIASRLATMVCQVAQPLVAAPAPRSPAGEQGDLSQLSPGSGSQIKRSLRVFFVGGGAKSRGVQKALKEALGAELHVPCDPQFVVALGAALIAADQLTLDLQ